MIDEKKIKEASKAYYRITQAQCSEIRDDEFEATGKDPGLFYVCADVSFMNGVEWAQREFVKSLWHSAEEEPEKFKPCLVYGVFTNGDEESFEDYCTTTYTSYGWTEDYFPRGCDGVIERWCYIDDILPKVEEE